MPYTETNGLVMELKVEKLLFVTDSDVDPLVIEAFMRVLRDEMKCQVDVVQEQGKEGSSRQLMQ